MTWRQGPVLLPCDHGMGHRRDQSLGRVKVCLAACQVSHVTGEHHPGVLTSHMATLGIRAWYQSSFHSIEQSSLFRSLKAVCDTKECRPDGLWFLGGIQSDKVCLHVSIQHVLHVRCLCLSVHVRQDHGRQTHQATSTSTSD